MAVLTFMIALVSLKNGFQSIRKVDYVLFGLSIAAIPIWLMTEDPTLSVIMVVIANTIAFIPTFLKSWKAPEDDSVSLFGVNSIRHFLSIFALTNFSPITLLPAIVMGLNNASFALFLLWRRKTLNPTNQVK